jgi:hypothetical protein
VGKNRLTIELRPTGRLTQGESPSELKENLKDIYHEFTSGNIPGVRKVGELVLQ